MKERLEGKEGIYLPPVAVAVVLRHAEILIALKGSHHSRADLSWVCFCPEDARVDAGTDAVRVNRIEGPLCEAFRICREVSICGKVISGLEDLKGL